MDIERIRRETPAVEELVHFNNAGCSLMPLPVSRALQDYIDSEQRIGGYETAMTWRDRLLGIKPAIASLINCSATEVAFAESNTRAWQQFFYSVPLQPGDNIITTRVDYGSNFVAYIQAARHRGVEIRYIQQEADGDLDLGSLEQEIDGKTRLISLSHIPTGSGVINPASEIGNIADDAGIPFLLDACQSVGHLDLDVTRLKCTALTATGRKYLRGARGTGFLYVAKDYLAVHEPLYLEQQSVNLIDAENYDRLETAEMFENFEGHFAGRLALGRAAEYAREIGTDNIEARVVSLAALCREELRSIPGVSVHDCGTNLCGIVTFSVDGYDANTVRSMLHNKQINIWVSDGPGSLVDFQNRGLEAVCRASVHYFNTEEEIGTFCSALERLSQS